MFGIIPKSNYEFNNVTNLKHFDYTNGYQFKGLNIQEKNLKVNFMSISAEEQFSHASPEEFRLADHEKKETGNVNKYKINDTSSKVLKLNFVNKEENLERNNNQKFEIGINTKSTRLFGNNYSVGGLSGNHNPFIRSIRNNNKGTGLFGNNNEDNENYNNPKADIVSQGSKTNNIIEFNNNNIDELSENNSTQNIIANKNARNNKLSSNRNIIKCNHEKNFVCFCIENSKNEGGLLCYECLFQYHKDHISKCIPINNNNFDNYKNFYKQFIKNYKINLKKKFDEIISKLEKYENEVIDNFSTLFEKNVDLEFELPIEVPFIERFEIAIKTKILSLLEEEIFDNVIHYNCLNLFKNCLKDLKIEEKNPNYYESIKLKSDMDFNLLGIGIPKIPEEDKREIEVKIYKGNSLLDKITEFENYENLSIGIFDSETIEIERGAEYSIELKGLKDLDYIKKEEKYNYESKIEICSSNSETLLACFIID